MPICKSCKEQFDIDDFGDSNIDTDMTLCPNCYWTGNIDDIEEEPDEFEEDVMEDLGCGDDQDSEDSEDEEMYDEALSRMDELESSEFDDDMDAVEEKFEADEGDYEV